MRRTLPIAVLVATLLAAAPVVAPAPARAEEAASENAAKDAAVSKRKQLEEELAGKREQLAAAEKLRDEARIKANTFQLPQYKLEADERDKTVDGLRLELEKLEKKLAELR